MTVARLGVLVGSSVAGSTILTMDVVKWILTQKYVWYQVLLLLVSLVPCVTDEINEHGMVLTFGWIRAEHCSGLSLIVRTASVCVVACTQSWSIDLDIVVLFSFELSLLGRARSHPCARVTDFVSLCVSNS